MDLTYTVTKNDKYENINQVLDNKFNISNRLKSKLIKNNKVLLNDKIIDTRTNITVNDTITVLLNFQEESENIVPIEMNLQIIYEDDAILVINKPARNTSSSFYTSF